MSGAGPTIRHLSLEQSDGVRGPAIVIDVVRAFTTAAYALAAGAQTITLVSGVDEARALRAEDPDLMLMGEVGGLPPPGFDFGNSPTRIEAAPVQGRRLVQRTGAGTQGAVRAGHAEPLYAASFAVASATARAMTRHGVDAVTLVATGDTWGDEDRACADFLELLLQGAEPDPTPYLDRVAAAIDRRRHDPEVYDTLGPDLERCMRLDAFDFAMRVRRESGRLVMRMEREASPAR